MGRGRLGVGLVVAAMLIALTGTAQAKRHAKFEVQQPGASGSVSLGTRNGYQANLYVSNDRVAILSVGKIKRRGDRSSISVAGYVVHTKGSLVSGTARGRIGSLGSFSLRFRPSGPVRERGVPRGCEGPPAVTEYGRFTGHVTFHGERHYLDFSLPGGNGELDRSFRLVCEKGRAYDPAAEHLRAYVAPGSFFATPENIALLYASARSHGRYIGVTAGHREEAPPGTEVRFGMFESRGAMAIGRYALALEPAATLLTSLPGEHPANATLAPPPPFYGEAHYQEKSTHSYAWTGNLGIDLFGVRMPLTGSGFHTRLCVLNPVRAHKGCDFFKAEPEFDERPARPWWMAR